MAELTYVRTPNIVAKLLRGHSEMNISDRIETLMFFYFSCLMATGALFWVSLCLYYGMYLSAMIPIVFIVATTLNFLSCNFSKENKHGRAFQVFISIALPFVFQYTLGGIVNSGVVMIWSVLALLGAMTFQSNKGVLVWVGLFSVLCIQALYMEATFFHSTSGNLPILIAGANFLFVSATIFGLCHYFIRIQKKLQETYALKRTEVRSAEERISLELSSAKEYQDFIRSSGHVSKAFSDLVSFDESDGLLHGNFYWQGEFIQNHIVVFVENPHKGMRGNMEAMIMRNMIENSVSKAEVQSPHNLIEFIQRDFYSKYDVPQIRESMMDLKFTVLCHDERKKEIQYASIGSTLLVNEGDKVKVLCGFDRDKGEAVTAPNGAHVKIGRVQLTPSSKVLFVNDALLEALDINDDQKLSCNKSKLSSFFKQDFESAKGELQKQVAKTDSKKDLFLLGLQI